MNDPLLNIAIKAARLAGEAIRNAFERLDTLNIQHKTPNDLVTDADIHVEQLIIQTIHQVYPDHAILGEETGAIDGKRDANGDEIVWIIDPIDGTNNFAHGLPHFAVSIAIEQGGKITHGVVYDPMRDELFSAVRGGGAKMNNRRIRVTDRPNLQASLLGTGFPFRNKEMLPTYLKTFEPLANRAAGIRRQGAAALDLAYVACGRFDGYWEFGLHNWDIAAGCLLVTEAGGMVSDMQGAYDFLKSGNVIAANRKLFKELLQVINGAL